MGFFYLPLDPLAQSRHRASLWQGVTDWQVGDHVSDLLVVGGCCERLLRDATDFVRVPDSVDAHRKIEAGGLRGKLVLSGAGTVSADVPLA
jgi:hypothetical protein